MLDHLTGPLIVTPSNVHDSVQQWLPKSGMPFSCGLVPHGLLSSRHHDALYFSFQFRHFMTDTTFLNHLDLTKTRRRADFNVS
ncbi:hypothetical protein NEUTE2DRAFT_80640, partial [Neurospora tetrasperma FGSC 2509]